MPMYVWPQIPVCLTSVRAPYRAQAPCSGTLLCVDVSLAALFGFKEAHPCLAVCDLESGGRLLQCCGGPVLVGWPEVHAGLERRNWRLQDGRVGKHMLYECYDLWFIDNSSTQLQHLSADQSSKTSADKVWTTPEMSCKLFSFMHFTNTHTHTMDDLFGVLEVWGKIIFSYSLYGAVTCNAVAKLIIVVLWTSAGTMGVLYTASMKQRIMGVSRCCGCMERTTRSLKPELWTSSCTGSMRKEVCHTTRGTTGCSILPQYTVNGYIV